MLTQLIYSSRTTRTLTNVDMNSVISTSRQNNLLLGITGALCYANGTFLQCLEGESSDINQLYKILLKDERHSGLKTLDVREISKRRFPNWTMGFFSYENELSQLFLKHSRMAEFTPFSMNASDSTEFFDEVVKYVSLSNSQVCDVA